MNFLSFQIEMCYIQGLCILRGCFDHNSFAGVLGYVSRNNEILHNIKCFYKFSNLKKKIIA